MHTHIGLNNKFKEGNAIPEVKENTSNAISEYIRGIKFERRNDLDKKMGDSIVEYDFKLCKNPDYTDKYFVISIRLKYTNESLKDTEYGVYCFDETGNIVDFSRENCKGNFYRDMQIIKEI